MARFRGGWIVVVDIVGYSLKADEIQRDIATFLVKSVETTHLYRLVLHEEEYSLICTGDGFILVVEDTHIADPREFLRFAEEIQAAVAAYGQRLTWANPASTREPDRSFDIRIGIHCGKFAFEHIFGQRNAIGTGINLAARIAGCGDAHDIIVSAEFALRCADAPNRLEHRQFLKPLGEAGIKHGFGIPIYSYHREAENQGAVFGRAAFPRSIKRQETIDEHIVSRMAGLESDLSVCLQSKNIDRNQAGLRLTILAPSTPNKTYLGATSYRHVHGEPAVASNSVFKLDPPEGVSAMAFEAREPQFITCLPDRYKEFDAYCKALERVNLKRDYVSSMKRPCRAFVAVPFSLPISSDRWYVLALDSLEALFPEDSDDAHELIEELKGATYELGLLLELKQAIPIPQTRRSR